jgi:nucleotide-binding universal stress UspA family protein
MFHRIVIGYDGSVGSRAALSTALRLARQATGTTVTAVTVQHRLPRYPATIAEVDDSRSVEAAAARRLRNEVAALVDELAGRVVHSVIPGHPARELINVARKQHADLIVLGRGSHSTPRLMLLGSIAVRVSRSAPCSVLIVR